MQEFPFVREAGEAGQAGLFGDFSADGHQIAARDPVGRIGEKAGEGCVVGQEQQPAGGLIQPPDGVERLQLLRQHIENRGPAFLILACRHHAFGFVKENESLGALLNRLVVKQDAVARPRDPGIG